MTYDVSTVGGQVFGIAGMGIGLGLLAGTARGITDTMYGQRQRSRPPARRRPPVRQTRRPPSSPYDRPSSSPYSRPYRQRPFIQRGSLRDFYPKRW